MRLIPKLLLGEGGVAANATEAAKRLARAGAAELLVVDLDASAAGAPQNVQALSDVIEAFPGSVIADAGVRLIHVAELILGLGAGQVIVPVEGVATDLALRNFASRFGAAVVYSGTPTEMIKIAESGLSVLVRDASPDDLARFEPFEVLVEPSPGFRNPLAWADVGVSGLIVEEGRYTKTL